MEPTSNNRTLTSILRPISSFTVPPSIVLPRLPCAKSTTQRVKRWSSGVLLFKFNPSSSESTAAGGGGGLRPSKAERGFNAVAASRYVNEVAITTSTSKYASLRSRNFPKSQLLRPEVVGNDNRNGPPMPTLIASH